MRNAIILHGLPSKNEYYSETYPSASNSHWLPWLQKQLLINDIKADTPEIPNVYAPEYEVFVKEVERFDITPQTTLVGHSMGAGFWVRYLTEHPEITVDKVILVAPWLNLDHKYSFDFFDFNIDQAITQRINEFVIFSSDNDDMGVQDTVKLLQQLPDAKVKDFHEYGHFTLRSMKTDAFPELLKAIV
ncbi:MAG TPA: alpha/beta hydrolase [Candidatus Saccharimonadaceae bacterium]|nr:alpha/beta hydrolase [Candidatus Saccharimonadaceae bacterium]